MPRRPRNHSPWSNDTDPGSTDTKEDRSAFENNVLLGPSMQYRPFPQMTMNMAPLFGVTDESDKSQLWINVGWEF